MTTKTSAHPHQWLLDLALSFHSIRDARVAPHERERLGLAAGPVVHWHRAADWPDGDVSHMLTKLAKWAAVASSSEAAIVSFLLTVWNGHPEAFGLPPFNVYDVCRWDKEHQRAFAAWAANPRTA